MFDFFRSNLTNVENVEKKTAEMLNVKDKRIVELENTLHQLKNSLSSLTENLKESRLHSENLEQKLQMLTDVLQVSCNGSVSGPSELFVNYRKPLLNINI